MSDVRANSGVPVTGQFAGLSTPSACAPLVVDQTTGWIYALKSGDFVTLAAAGGTVQRVAATFGGGLVSISGSPVSGTGTIAFSVAGQSGGLVYFSGPSAWASTAAGTSSQVAHGGNPPTFTKVDLAADVSGTLAIGNGGTGNATWLTNWTPTRTGWTDVGSPTVTARYATISNNVFFQVKVVPGTTIAAVGGTSYIDLPVAMNANALSGDGSMLNETTLIGVGNVVFDVANSRCYVPSQAATGNTLGISGWYEK